MKHLYLASCLIICFSTSLMAQEIVYSNSTMPQDKDSGSSSNAMFIPTVAPLGPSSYGEKTRPNDSDAANSPVSNVEAVVFTYLEKVTVAPPNRSVDHDMQTFTPVTARLEVNCDLDKIDLPPDGMRAGVQAITAVRHRRLLQALKMAKTDPEKAEAAKGLEENYRSHYASETKWRMNKIAEIEKRLEEMRSQVNARASSEDKYVEAAVTLAKLYAQGIASEPPALPSVRSPSESVYPYEASPYANAAPLPGYGLPQLPYSSRVANPVVNGNAPGSRKAKNQAPNQN